MGLFRRNRKKAAATPLTEQTAVGTEQAETKRREVTTEARPNPDQPGWGQIAGQAIGKTRQNRQQ